MFPESIYVVVRRSFAGAQDDKRVAQDVKGVAQDDSIAYLMRSVNAAFTAALARRAPSTSIESMVASASSGETSSAILTRPSTLICNFSPAVRTASRS